MFSMLTDLQGEGEEGVGLKIYEGAARSMPGEGPRSQDVDMY